MECKHEISRPHKARIVPTHILFVMLALNAIESGCGKGSAEKTRDDKLVAPSPRVDQPVDRTGDVGRSGAAAEPSGAQGPPWEVEPVKVRLDGDWGVATNAKLAKFVVKATRQWGQLEEVGPCIRLYDKDGAELEKSSGDDADPNLAQGESQVLTTQFLLKKDIWEETTTVVAYMSTAGCASTSHEAASNVLTLDRELKPKQ